MQAGHIWCACENRLSGLLSQADNELHPDLYFCRRSFGFKGHVRLRKKDPTSGKMIFLVVREPLFEQHKSTKLISLERSGMLLALVHQDFLLSLPCTIRDLFASLFSPWLEITFDLFVDNGEFWLNRSCIRDILELDAYDLRLSVLICSLQTLDKSIFMLYIISKTALFT